MTGIPSRPGAPMLFNKSLAIPSLGHVQGFFHSLLPNALPPSVAWRNTTHPTRPSSNIIPFETLWDAAPAGRIAISPVLPQLGIHVGYRARSMLGSGSFPPTLPCLGVPRWPGWGRVLVSHPSPSSCRSCINTWRIEFQNRDVWLSLLLPHFSRDTPICILPSFLRL